MSDPIDVSSIAPAALLAGLYNASKPLGLGMMHFTPDEMTEAEAQKLLDGGSEETNFGRKNYFDYLKGRVMKVEINGETLSPWLYDRDNGQGAAQHVVDFLLETASA